MKKPTKAVANNANPAKGKRKPPQWEKWRLCALFRLMGHTQEEMAQLAGVPLRTLQHWMSDKTRWHKAERSAEKRWLSEATAEARVAVIKSLRSGNAVMGMDFLSRVDKRLAPPKARTELSGKVEGGVLMVPAPVDPESWAKAAAEQQGDLG